MSAFLLGLGFRADMGTCARKLVLLKLIDACEDDGSRIFPAMATVARAAQCSTRQVQREIRAFQDVGLLKLVRQGGNGPRNTNEYALDLDVLGTISKAGWEAFRATVPALHAPDDDGEEKGDTVSPLDEPEKGDIGGAERVTPATDKGDKLCHPTPPDSSNNPSEERARGHAGLGEETDSSDDPRKFERRVKRIADKHGWPNWTNSSTAWTVKRFAELTAAERLEAETHAGAYIAACGKKALSLGTYFQERKWKDLPAEALAPKAEPAVVEAKPFGKVWGYLRLREFFFTPAQASPAAKPGSFLATLMAQNDAAGRRERMAQQARYGWPQVNTWHERAQNRRGFAVAAAQASVPVEMEFVPVDTAIWKAWEEEHLRRGWPWLPAPGEMRGAWFPVGGPEGLADFEAAVRGNDDEGQGQRAAAE